MNALPRILPIACAAIGASACGDNAEVPIIGPTENWDRDLLRTDLRFDIEGRTGEARIRFAKGATGASLEMGDLEVHSVTLGGAPLAFRAYDGGIDLALPGREDGEVAIQYGFEAHDGFEGYRSLGSTLTWPSWCGNLFPCKSDPAEGALYSVDVQGVPRGESAIFTPMLAHEAPAYMVAFAHGIYEYLDRGRTSFGTQVGAYFHPGGKERAESGTEFLADYVEFFENTLGPYPFGNEIAAVSVSWGLGAFGGIEHHPFFHVASAAMASREVMAHEVAHGWFGNGVRIACWEDLVLSEGVAQYLTLRAIEAAEGTTASDALWGVIYSRLQSAVATGDTVAYPDGCQEIDILDTPLVSRIPYEKGAFFFRAVEAQIGRSALDSALASFFQERVGSAARMSELVSHIEIVSGASIASLESAWLRRLGIPEQELP